MSDPHPLIAYCATLFAIMYLVTIGAVASWNGHSIEALGVAAAVTGLIGVCKLPSNRTTTIDNAANDPVPITNPGDPS